MPKPLAKWTPQERAWVQSFRRHGNAARAVREAGYDVDPDNVRLHAQMGREIMARPHIQEAIEIWQEDLRKQFSIEPEAILGELAKIAFFNLGDLFPVGKDGKRTARPGMDLSDVPDHVWAALARFEERHTEHGVNMKVEAHSKIQALELLGKYAKLWVDRVQIDQVDDPVEKLRASRRFAGLDPDYDTKQIEGGGNGRG